MSLIAHNFSVARSALYISFVVAHMEGLSMHLLKTVASATQLKKAKCSFLSELPNVPSCKDFENIKTNILLPSISSIKKKSSFSRNVFGNEIYISM